MRLAARSFRRFAPKAAAAHLALRLVRVVSSTPPLFRALTMRIFVRNVFPQWDRAGKARFLTRAQANPLAFRCSEGKNKNIFASLVCVPAMKTQHSKHEGEVVTSPSSENLFGAGK